MEIKKIFKREIALQLINKKHKLVYTEPNRNKSWLSVFCFLETEELLKDLSVLTNHNN